MAEYPVGEVARLTRVSVRTLHHYDEIGLLHPSGRTAAGYRLYSASDLQRLRQILGYRELDFGLAEITAILDESGCSVADHLRRQRDLLRARIDRDERLLAAVEKELEAHTMGMSLTPEEQFEVFGTDQVGGEWADEARQQWGETEAYRESQRRTADYSKQDWQQLKAESDAALRAWRQAMSSGEAATGEHAMNLAEQHRQFLGRHFYDCSYEQHRGLAELYLADPRFTQTFETVAPGLAQYVHDAIVANATRPGI